MKPPSKRMGGRTTGGRTHFECGCEALYYALLFAIVALVFFVTAIVVMAWQVFTWPGRVVGRWW